MTEDVLKVRSYLSDAYLFNDYYFQRLEEIVNRYPVEWVQSSGLYSNLRSHFTSSRFNIETLFGADSDSGAMGCYNDPKNCPIFGDSILKKLKPVDEKSIMLAIEPLKYKYVLPWNGPTPDRTCKESVYQTGDSETNFKAKVDPKCHT